MIAPFRKHRGRPHSVSTCKDRHVLLDKLVSVRAISESSTYPTDEPSGGNAIWLAGLKDVRGGEPPAAGGQSQVVTQA